MIDEDALRAKYRALAGLLDERSFRLCLAGDAMALGRGGISQVGRASGASRTTIHAGLRELRACASAPSPELASPARSVRRPGGGRKARPETDATLLEDLDQLLDPVTRGDPMSPLRWTCKSTTKLAAELRGRGHVVSQA